MAITQGVGPHAAWLTINGQEFPIEHGQVSQEAKRKSAQFSGIIPLSYPGAYEMAATTGDNEATITVLVRGQISTLVTGEVDHFKSDLINRTIHFTGRDKSAKLHEQKSSEKWLNKKPSEIVQDLIGRVGLSGNITASQIMAGKKLEQDFVHLSDNVSFGYLIHKLSQLDGCRWFVDAQGMFHYVPIGSPTGTYSITINQDREPIAADCLELQIGRNVQAGKSIQATVKSWHPKLKQVFSYTSNVEGNGGPTTYNYHVPNLQQDHVTKRAKSQATEKAMHELNITATVVGDPAVSAGMGLQLNGTTYYDQTYDISTVHHDFGMSGYRTHITAQAAKSGRTAS
jgi:hypothetical protein